MATATSSAQPPSIFTRLFYRLRTEGETPSRVALAIGLGLFIGCTPLYGLHLGICVLTGYLLGLNRIKLYVAANISNPLLAPFLVFAEIQVGSLLLSGKLRDLPKSRVSLADGWAWGMELVVGSIALGMILGLVGGVWTWHILTRSKLAPADRQLCDRAAVRYLDSGLFAWEYAHEKLRHDPVYLDLARPGRLPEAGRIVDLGCGPGLLFSLLIEARQLGRLPPSEQPELIGIEGRSRSAKRACKALGGFATIEVGNLATAAIPSATAALLIDVLHYLPTAEQEQLLDRVVGSLEPGGRLFVRDADASAKSGFAAVRVAERLQALLRGEPAVGLHYRSADGWREALVRRGLEIEVGGMGQGTPFANVLLVGYKRSQSPD